MNHIYGAGYGLRATSACFGMNSYRDQRNTMRPHPPPFTDEEEIDKHQYFNGNLKAFLLQALLEKRTDHLGHNAVQLACGFNHTLHEMMGFCSTKIIATSGQLPTTKLSTAPLAFANCCHTDLCDQLSWEQLLDLKNEWDQDCFKRKLLDFQGFSVPTTCGYQFVYESDDIFKLSQFFPLNGLGLAMDICHGMMHHFMAASFPH